MDKTITLDQDTPSIIHLCQKDKRLAKVISMIGPITCSLHQDPYVFLIHEIIEQIHHCKEMHYILIEPWHTMIIHISKNRDQIFAKRWKYKTVLFGYHTPICNHQPISYLAEITRYFPRCLFHNTEW